jgi:dihydrofolate reductase
MRRLIVSTFLTLDGVMQAPGGPGEDEEGNFEHGGWSVHDWDDTLQVHGSGNFVQTLLRAGLVDEFRLWVFPLVLGEGKRLFADGTIPGGLRLVDSTVSTTGVVIGTYEPAGEVVTGSFALEQPA